MCCFEGGAGGLPSFWEAVRKAELSILVLEGARSVLSLGPQPCGMCPLPLLNNRAPNSNRSLLLDEVFVQCQSSCHYTLPSDPFQDSNKPTSPPIYTPCAACDNQTKGGTKIGKTYKGGDALFRIPAPSSAGRMKDGLALLALYAINRNPSSHY